MGTKGRVALGTLPLAGLIAATHALEAEYVEALGQHCILLAGVAAGAGQACLEQNRGSRVRAAPAVPALQAKSTQWQLLLILTRIPEGGSRYSMKEETGSEAKHSKKVAHTAAPSLGGPRPEQSCSF